MPFVRVIYPETQRLLKRIYHNSRHHQVRQRSHCLLLRNQGIKVAQLADIFQVTRKTLYNWFEAWDTLGLVGLYNRPGRGRKPTFTPEQKDQIQQWVQAHPRQLKSVLSKIKEQWGITVSPQTIKRIIKSMHMSWHRFRRVPWGQPDPDEYAQKKAQLECLKRLDELDVLDLYYLDQAGFSLIPCVPYGWQMIGEILEIPSCPSQRLNVLGIMNRRNDLKSYVWEQSINSDVVICCIDASFPKPQKRTVIVIDQAPIHTSDAVQDKYQEWRERNIEIFELPCYSPQLNLIEILWRFIKYQWLEVSAYRCWNSLVSHVENILREVGDKYVINFV
ncbi:MAG: IS630 family transposase [Thermosynechococcaceae cyanobacterium]